MKYIMGILVGIAVLVAVTTVTAQFIFKKQVNQEVAQLYPDTDLHHLNRISREELAALPACVQQWIEHSGVMGKEEIKTVRLQQTGSMRTAPDKGWMPFTAEQYFNYEEPGFIWHARIKAAPLVHISGRDKYYQGKGNMLIKVMSLFKVADATGKETDQGSLVRHLAEMMWQPAAALRDYIEWEEIDAQSARATMTDQGITASGIFTFDDQGNVVSFSAKRYRDLGDGTFALSDWYTPVYAYQEFDGVLLPSEAEIIWKLPEGDFSWFKLEVTEWECNRTVVY